MDLVIPTIINISAYKFTPLENLPVLRSLLRLRCNEWELKGTILLAREGINLFVAGPREATDRLLVELRAIPGLESLEVKLSESDTQPFHRMLVKIKKEIIPFGVDGIDPAKSPTRKLSAKDLKRWLDEGRAITLLDTRNDYEVKLGTFKNAMTLGLNHFRDFPEAVRKLPGAVKKSPIVMFCTGGIRCEKAGPFMEREGFPQVFQLEGGILKYFEQCGGEHYTGECFVFDQRVGLDAQLNETSVIKCFVCLEPLVDADQTDARYLEGQSCPYCFESDEESTARTISSRHEAISRVTTPLPGSQSYEIPFPIIVPEESNGTTIKSFVGSLFRADTSVSRRFLDNRRHVVPANTIVRSGEHYLCIQTFASEPAVNVQIRILYEDDSLIVLEKPVQLPISPEGDFRRNTLQYILSKVYEPQSPRPLYRLDRSTPGILVLARTKQLAALLRPQFDTGNAKCILLARVRGHSIVKQFRLPELVGHEQIGHVVETLNRFEDGTSLLAIELGPASPHGIPGKLREFGLPLLEKEGAGLITAWRVEMTNPRTKKRWDFETELPDWAT